MSEIYKCIVRVGGPGPCRVSVGHLSSSEYEDVGGHVNIIPTLDSITHVSSRSDLEFDLSKQQVDQIRSGTRRVFLFSTELNNCSISRAHDTFMPDSLQHQGFTALNPDVFLLWNRSSHSGYDGELAIPAQNAISVSPDTAIEYTARQMSQNINSIAAEAIRNAPWGNTGSGFPRGNTKEFIMADMGHPDEGVRGAIFTAGADLLSRGGIGNPVYRVTDSGSWDLKPRIDSNWGHKIRFGNEEWYTEDQHLSNIHYGYVAAATGFSITQAIQLAGIQVAGNREDPGDEWPTVIGHDLFRSYPNGITGHQLLLAMLRARGNTYRPVYTSSNKRYTIWETADIDNRFPGE